MSNIELNAKATELRKRLGEDENSFIDIFKMINQIERLTLVLYPMGENISGICIKSEDSNLIAINSNMSYGRQRFSLAHEFYHLFFDNNYGASISSKNFNTTNPVEKEADQFAAYFLAPYNALRAEIQKIDGELTLKDIIALEQLFGMSHQAMLWRLIGDGYIDKTETDRFSGKISYYAKLYGYDDKLYFPSKDDAQKRTYGNYIQQAESLKNSDIISIGKYEELLLDAFRYDIVYGDDEIGGEIYD